MQSMAQAKLKRTRAVELAAAGHSYDQIAHEVGFSHRGSAHRAVYKALGEREVEAVDDLRRLELDRLDALQAALWGRAMDGEAAAVTLVLKVIDQRVRVLGLQTAKSLESADPQVLVLAPAEGNPGKATR
jgi:hypothetical protein